MDANTHTAQFTSPRVLLTVEEAAHALSLGRTYTYDLVMRREIASIKIGRKRLVPVTALQEFINRQPVA
jgi:excisionase family DNA binding protein